MKKLQKTPNFFSRNETFFVFWLGTIVFCTLLMLISTKIYKLDLPFTFWKIFVESIGFLGLLISTLTLLWGIFSARREAERSTQIKQITQLTTKQDDYYNKIISQQETDRRLEQIINYQQQKIDDLQAQVGRIAVRVAQFESEKQTRRRLERIEKFLSTDST